MFDRDEICLGITPTCWTNDDFPHLGEEISFEQCVSEMALAGFEGCSVGHKFPTDLPTLRAALELRGLRITEPWASTYFTAKGMRDRTIKEFQRQLAFMKYLGGTQIVVAELGGAVHQQPIALLSNKPVLDKTGWRTLLAVSIHG